MSIYTRGSSLCYFIDTAIKHSSRYGFKDKTEGIEVIVTVGSLINKTISQSMQCSVQIHECITANNKKGGKSQSSINHLLNFLLLCQDASFRSRNETMSCGLQDITACSHAINNKMSGVQIRLRISLFVSNEKRDYSSIHTSKVTLLCWLFYRSLN